MSKMKFRHIPSFLILAGLLCACSQDEPTDSAQSNVGQPLVLTVGFPTATRATVDNYWDGGETVYVQIMDNYDGNNADWTDVPILEYTVGADGKRLNYESGEKLPVWGKDETQKLIRAWYSGTVYIYNRDKKAYENFTVEALTNPLQWNVASNQNGDNSYYTGMNNYEGSDFVFAQTIATPNQREVPLTFYHQVAKVVLNVRHDFSDNITYRNAYIENTLADIGNLSFTAPAYGEAYGTWTINQTSGYSYIIMKSIEPNTVSFDGKSMEKAEASYEALVIPKGPTLESEFWVYTSFNDTSFKYDINNSSSGWKAGHVYTYNLTLSLHGLQLSSSSESVGWDTTTGASDNGEVVL